MGRTLWSYQPLKGVYFAWFFITSPPYLLSLSISYLLVKSRRPVPQWSIRQCLGRAYLKSWFHAVSVTQHQDGTQLVVPGKASERFVLIEPPPDDLFTGILAPGIINPSPVKAIWFPSPVQEGAQKVVLHFPGGAFVLPLATNEVGESVSGLMTRHMEATTFFAQYRHSQNADTRFPAAIQDLLTCYYHVLKLGVDPKRIILSGDSAGRNLVIALVRYLETCQTKLPLPYGAMAWSPAVNFTAEAGRDYNSYKNSPEDILRPSLCQWAADAYLPKRGADYENEARPFFSPLHHPFETKVPLFIHAGTKEAFYDGVKEFSEEMSRVQGNRIRFHQSELAPHDILLTHKLLNFTDEVESAIKDACDFFEREV